MIYFATARSVNLVKIGYSQNPQTRFVQIRADSPIPTQLERVCGGSRDDEAALHERFAKYRSKGEWFLLAPEIEAHMAQLDRHVWRHRGCQHHKPGQSEVNNPADGAGL